MRVLCINLRLGGRLVCGLLGGQGMSQWIVQWLVGQNGRAVGESGRTF